MGGQIDVAFETAASATPPIKGGKIRPLAITTAKRSPAMPDLPDRRRERLAGLRGAHLVRLAGAGRNAQGDRRAAQYGSRRRSCRSPEIKQRIADISSETGGIPSEQFADLIKKETVKWAKVVKDSGATVD